MGSRLAGYATTIAFYTKEIVKPDSQRLDGYHDADLDSLKFGLLSAAPVYKDFEEANLAGSLQMSLGELGPDDPFIKIVLGGRTPAEVAKELISGTALADEIQGK